jgi:hypothetical protein
MREEAGSVLGSYIPISVILRVSISPPEKSGIFFFLMAANPLIAARPAFDA